MTTNFDPFPDPFNAPGANERFATTDLQATKLLLDQINVSAGNVTKTLHLGFGSAAASGRSFNDVLSTIAQSLARMAVRAGTKALAEGLVSGLSGMFSGAFLPREPSRLSRKAASSQARPISPTAAQWG